MLRKRRNAGRAHFQYKLDGDNIARYLDSGAGLAGDEGMVQASLNGTLNVQPFATFLADERFDHAEAGESIQRSAMWTRGGRDFRGCEFHQPRARAVDGNRIDHGAARVTFDLHHPIAALHNHQAAVAIHASGEFVRQDEIPAFVLGHIV